MSNESNIAYTRLTLSGVSYAVIPERVLSELARRAGVAIQADQADGTASAILPLGGERIAERLVERRQAAKLSQAELARRAGVRVETLNRIERGHTTPDFTTVRRLVEALQTSETAAAREALKPRRRTRR